MLTEIHIKALLVDEELADQVWEAWDKGEIGWQVVGVVAHCISSASPRKRTLR